MIYKVIDDFLNEKLCKDLIIDANLYCRNVHTKVLNQRLLLPSTSLAFIELLKKSGHWKDLHNQINSKDFLEKLSKLCDIRENTFSITNYFFNYSPGFFLKKYKEINSRVASTIGNKNLIFYIFFKIYRYFLRVLKFKFSLKNYTELLYDYSKSPNGYHREIHRDSDSRTIVFLLYLNSLSVDATGGELKLFKYKKEEEKIPAQPKEQDCDLVETIAPKVGRLVVFLNSYDSLHSVSEMKNHDEYRHFLYGSFTLLAKKNKFLSNSKGNLKTNFNIFE